MTNRKILITFLAAMAVLLFGCGGQTATSVTAATNGGEFPLLEQADEIAAVVLYEITENNFQEGLYHSFSDLEVSQWRDIMRTGTCTVRPGTLAKADTKYIAAIFDSGEAELADFRLDQELNLYTEDGTVVVCGELKELLEEIIQQYG